MKQGSNLLLKNNEFLYLKGKKWGALKLRSRADTKALLVNFRWPILGHLSGTI